MFYPGFYFIYMNCVKNVFQNHRRPEPEPEIVFLKHVERAKYQTPRPEEDKIYPPPRFIVPLANVSQYEDGRIHFEARIEPVGDPTLVAEWFVNGYPLQASKFLFNHFVSWKVFLIIIYYF